MGFDNGTVTFGIDHTPLAQNRGTILMGIVFWRVTEKPKIIILGPGRDPHFLKMIMNSTSGPAAEIPDGADGCAIKS